ncbi:putative apoptosis inhibitor 5-like isoform X2 [Raphanus sativus]|nr:putative apoptosis inhibitor 5-like isoform X2 [Raphanus sativus]
MKLQHAGVTPTTDDQIREKVLNFIRDKVFPIKAELLKPQEEMERHITDLIKQSLEDVTGGEFKMFMDFLTSLSIFGWKAPQERMQELVEIIEGQADLNAQFDISDTDHIDRFISCLLLALPFFAVRIQIGAVSRLIDSILVIFASCFANFVLYLSERCSNQQLPEERKLDLLKALADTVVKKLILTTVEDLTKTTMKKLTQGMSEHNKAMSAAKTDEEKASVKTKKQNTTTGLRTCNNILAMTKQLHAKVPSFIGNTNINLSWKEATKPLASATTTTTRTIGGKRPANSNNGSGNNGAAKKRRGSSGMPNQLVNKAFEGISSHGGGGWWW